MTGRLIERGAWKIEKLNNPSSFGMDLNFNFNLKFCHIILCLWCVWCRCSWYFRFVNWLRASQMIEKFRAWSCIRTHTHTVKFECVKTEVNERRCENKSNAFKTVTRTNSALKSEPVKTKKNRQINKSHFCSVARTFLGWNSYLTQCWNPLPLTFIDVNTKQLPTKWAVYPTPLDVLKL